MDYWSFLIELAILSALGALYYFWQKRKILAEDANKAPMIMGYILQSCLAERGDNPHVRLDPIIESIDDYLHGKAACPPTSLLKVFSESSECSSELRDVIQSGLEELTDGKK